MARERFRVRWTIRLGLVLIGLLLCVPALAVDPPKTLQQRMERELLRLRVQIQNAKMRLEQGLVGAIDSAGVEEGPVTPMRTCCSVNLRKMRGAVEELAVVFAELEQCQRAADNYGAVSTLGFARNDLQGVARAIRALADAPSQTAAQGALGGMTRVYLGLLETSEGIEDCGEPDGVSPDTEAGESAPEPDKPEKRKKEKQQQTEDGSGG